MRRLVERYGRRAKSYLFASDGNVTMIFALAIIPLIAFIGIAIDYSRANAARTAMQAALDSTALMLSKDAGNLSDTQLAQKAKDYFNAMYLHPEARKVKITPTLTSPQPSSFKITMTGSGIVDATFSKVIGQSEIDFSTSSQVVWGIKKLELALALDNTGSMGSSGKMSALKTASHTLLDTMKKAAKKDGDVKVAIIPFDISVNLGTSYKDQPWFDPDSIDCNGSKKGTGCNSSTWKNHWEGCVRDRAYPYDTQDTTPDPGNTKTLFPVADCGNVATLLPLTTDWQKLHSKVDQMNPSGNTNVSIGLAWGWHALSKNAPLSEAAEPSPDLDKVLIILTDGDNTESWDNTNNKKVTSQSTIDARTALTCSNIKAANIKIYAVRVIDGNATLLKNCATNPGMYYDVQQANQLNNVFAAIAQNLANLRIAK